jgi:hypothetical protein
LFLLNKLKPARTRSLPLQLPVTRERAYEITEQIPISASFSPFSMKTNGRTRGPYYRVYFRRNGRVHMFHLGNEERLCEVQAAHELVRAELEAEAATIDPRIGDMLARHAYLYGEIKTPFANLKRSTPARPGTAAGASATIPTGEGRGVSR